MTTGLDIVAGGRAWVDVSYLHQHATRAGCDCLGLVIGVGREAGLLKGYRPPAYSANPDGIAFRRECDSIFDRHFGRIEPGMLGVFWYAKRGLPQHMAIFTNHCHGGLGMLHANNANNRVREHRIDDFWTRRFVRAYRFRGVDY